MADTTSVGALLQTHAGKLKKILKKHKAGKELSAEERALIGDQVPGTDVIGEPDPTSYDSIGAAAAGLDVPIGVLKKLKRQGSKAFRGSRVYTAELKEAIKGLVTSGGATNAKEQAELRIFIADAEFKEMRNAIQANRFTRNEVFIAAIDDLANEQRTILRQKLENEYPGVVAGLEPAQARVYGKKVVDQLFRLMQALKDRLLKKLAEAQPPGEDEK